SLIEDLDISINFAYRTFKWRNEATGKAAVHCVIIGFSYKNIRKNRKIFDGDKEFIAKNINAYLLDAPTIFVVPRTKPLCDVSKMRAGNKPVDGNFLKIEDRDYLEFITKEPKSKKYIKKLIGGNEFLHNEKRWVLWLVGVSPKEIRSMPLVYDRVKKVREARLNMKDAGAIKLADTPTTFRDTLNYKHYIVIPIVSSESREYVPLGFFDENTIPTNQVQLIPDANLYEFGILSSSVHMAWMRGVCGRFEMRYRYTAKIVYNTFPWPKATDEEKSLVEDAAQEILNERAKFTEESLAGLYDSVLMPQTLRRAHNNLDKVVRKLYGFTKETEQEIIIELMKRYDKLAKK
ncbi:type IIL restriction-modification enzyme MmeI, partial [Bacillus sp. GMa5/2]